MQGEFSADLPPLRELIRHGLGQLTRVFGTRPLPPPPPASRLARLQAQIIGRSRFGIPAIAHEECLTGFAAWTATAFPTPLAWGAAFDPELVARDGRGDRRQHAGGRRAPGPGAGARRGP